MPIKLSGPDAIIYTMEYYVAIKKTQGIFTFCNGMVEPREYYAKWNKPVGERQTPHDFTHMWNQNQLTNKIETEAWIRGTDWQLSEWSEELNEGRGTWMTHRHRQQCADGQREGGQELDGGGQRGWKMGTSVIVSIIKIKKKIRKKKIHPYLCIVS